MTILNDQLQELPEERIRARLNGKYISVKYVSFDGAWKSNLEVIVRESVRTSIMLICSILTLAGCQIAGDIFKAGVWVGAALVIGIIALIVWFVSRA